MPTVNFLGNCNSRAAPTPRVQCAVPQARRNAFAPLYNSRDKLTNGATFGGRQCREPIDCIIQETCISPAYTEAGGKECLKRHQWRHVLHHAAGPTGVQFDEKNIRRRVYDALNVLMAINVIRKVRRDKAASQLMCH